TLSSHSAFLFLAIRRPPTSPLFPYTTLFRSQTASRPASGNIFTASQARLPIYGYYFINYKLYIDVIRLVFDNTRHHGKQGKLHAACYRSLDRIITRLARSRRVGGRPDSCGLGTLVPSGKRTGIGLANAPGTGRHTGARSYGPRAGDWCWCCPRPCRRAGLLGT